MEAQEIPMHPKLMQFKTIVMPTDLSEHSLRALPYAAELAKAHDATLLLAHLVRSQASQEKARATLDDLVAKIPSLRKEVIVEVGDPVPGLLDLIQKRRVDLAVMATRGRTGLVKHLMGSVAEALMRKAACPVMTVKHPVADVEANPKVKTPPVNPLPSGKIAMLHLRQRPPSREDLYFAQIDGDRLGASLRAHQSSEALVEGHPRIRIGKILHPTDFSAPSHLALAYAADMARVWHAKLEILFVRDMGEEEVQIPADDSFFDRPQLKELAVAMRALLAGKEDLDVELTVSAGRPVRVIVADVIDHEIDLVVMGTRGKTGAQRLLLGSTAEGVVQHSPCPVMTIRSDIR